MNRVTESIIVLMIVTIITLIGNKIGYKFGLIEALPGLGILLAICIAGVLSNNYLFKKLPTVLYVVTFGTIITMPGFPGSQAISQYVGKVHFLALTTPILAYVGVGIGKDLDSLKKTGWRIVIVSLVVMISTYVCSAGIAQAILKFMGEI